MQQRIYTIEEITQKLRPVFKDHCVQRAVLFGSYSQRRATAQSDVDIMVDSGLRGLAFYGLLEDVSVQLDKPVDLIDITQIKGASDIKHRIDQDGVLIYEQ